MDIVLPSSLRDKLQPFIEQGRERAQAIHAGTTHLTIQDETDITSGVAKVTDDGYMVYDYYALENARRLKKQNTAHDLAWEDILANAPD